MKIVKEKNRKRIEEWLSRDANREKTKKDCCKELGITYATLRSHLKEIEKK